MYNFYKCQSKAISRVVAAGTTGATEVSETIAPVGTRVCVRSFSGSSTSSAYQSTAITAAGISTLVLVELHMKDPSETTILEVLLPFLPTLQSFAVGGTGGVNVFHIPGPGLISSEGLGVKMTIPANPQTGVADGGEIGAVFNLVYSL